MTFNINGFVDRLREMFSPNREKEEKSEPDKITEVAQVRIKRSPGRTDLASICDEPEWYHEQ